MTIRLLSAGALLCIAMSFAPARASAPRALEVGDSITVALSSTLHMEGIATNGVVGQQFSTGAHIIENLRAEHRLPPRVVVELGTNGVIYSADERGVIRALSGRQRVVIVGNAVAPWSIYRNAQAWIPGNNRVLRYMARVIKNARYVDWDAMTRSHQNDFGPDGLHPSARGIAVLAGAISRDL